MVWKIFTSIMVLLTLVSASNANSYPNEKAFTEDRIECVSKELDVKISSGHLPNSEAGVIYYKRLSLDAERTIYYEGGKWIRSLMSAGNHKVETSIQNFETAFEYDTLVKQYFPESLLEKFQPVWQKCLTEQSAHQQ